MANRKVTIEVEVPEDFKPMEGDCASDCPFGYLNNEDGEGMMDCNYYGPNKTYFTCPMEKMKIV